MREFMYVSKALADENRVRILMALRGRELCVCQIIELLGLAPSTVSKHIAILKQARLVEGRKEGRWAYYRLAEENNMPTATSGLRWVESCLEKDKRIREDAAVLRRIIRRERGELCQEQTRLRARP